MIDTDVAPPDLEERALWHLELEERSRWLSGADLDEPDDEGDDAYFDDFDDSDDPWNTRDTICRHCSGTGGDPWNDGILPCEHCDGEGYAWWQ